MSRQLSLPFLYATILIVVSFLLAVSPPVGASPVVSRGHASVSVIDSGRTGQLTIRFTLPNPYDDRPGPSPAGVEVQLRRVANIDLTTLEGWQEAESLTLTQLLHLPESGFDSNRVGTSDHTGTIVFPELPLGVYVVTSPHRQEVWDPFVVTLPRTGPDGSSWMYEVTVHPKWRGQPTTTTEPAPTTEWETTWPTQVEPTVTETATPEVPTRQKVTPAPRENDPKSQTDSRPRPLGERLASTGAAVIGVVVLGLLLVTMGLVAIVRGQKKRNSE